MNSATRFGVFALAMLTSALVGLLVEPTWTVERVQLDVQTDDSGGLYYIYEGDELPIDPVLEASSVLGGPALPPGDAPAVKHEIIVADGSADGLTAPAYYQLHAQPHWGIWSLLPPLCAVLLCWITREPVTALMSGILSGALILTQYDITGEVLIPSLATTSAAGLIVLYLWLLGGLMGIWSRTGAAQAFAQFMTERFVRGPRTAKLVAWFLGVVFFQGGTVSTVVVGTTVRPIADAERVSHEELSYVVDSTASPIASQLAFNSWPGYVQAFIFVSGASFLATETDRIAFFFQSVPFCFYAILAVLGTFLLSVEKPPFLGHRMREAIKRARTTGELDAPGATPLAAAELQGARVPEGYKSNLLDFFLPLAVIIVLAIGTFVMFGSPNVHWAFGAALLLAFGMALARGMSVVDLIAGFGDGVKSLVLGSVILLLAVTIGGISSQTGGGIYLVEQLGDGLPWFVLPVLFQVMTMVIAFSTGTSWGTYAVAFPLAMPLAWAVANSQGLSHPEFFMTLCFAAVMDGSVYGDQCSPISDTSVLSSVCTGCDLMDHIKTQIPQATLAAALASVGWTILAFFCA